MEKILETLLRSPQTQGYVFLLIMAVVILQNLDKILNFINGLKSKGLDSTFHRNDDCLTMNALKDLNEIREWRSKGLPYMERPRRERMLEFHAYWNGKYSYKQVMSIYENIQFFEDGLRVIFPWYKRIKFYMSVF